MVDGPDEQEQRAMADTHPEPEVRWAMEDRAERDG